MVLIEVNSGFPCQWYGLNCYKLSGVNEIECRRCLRSKIYKKRSLPGHEHAYAKSNKQFQGLILVNLPRAFLSSQSVTRNDHHPLLTPADVVVCGLRSDVRLLLIRSRVEDRIVGVTIERIVITANCARNETSLPRHPGAYQGRTRHPFPVSAVAPYHLARAALSR